MFEWIVHFYLKYGTKFDCITRKRNMIPLYYLELNRQQQDHSALALYLEAVGAHQTLDSPNWERWNNMNHLLIILLKLEADAYLNLLQGNIAILQYCIIKVLKISSNLDP